MSSGASAQSFYNSLERTKHEAKFLLPNHAEYQEYDGACLILWRRDLRGEVSLSLIRSGRGKALRGQQKVVLEINHR